MYFELITEIYFALDILMTFNTGIYQKGILIMKRKVIFIAYGKFWFWCDVIASLPYSYIIDSFSSGG